jgi:hypothetical protein
MDVRGRRTVRKGWERHESDELMEVHEGRHREYDISNE